MVHTLVAHVESVLILKVFKPMVGHANTPAPSDTEFSDAQFVIEVQPPHEGEGPEASENWTRCPCRRVPTSADTVFAVADKDKTAVAVVLASIEIFEGSWYAEPTATVGAQ